MGAFQASMLEAFNSLREDFQKSLQKQGEVDQTSSSASKMNAPSKDLAKPSQSSSALESMEVEYGPELPPRLDSYSSRLEDDSGQVRVKPLNSVIKDAFNKFDQDFQAANLPEGKYIKPPPSTAKWYKVGQLCFEDKIQELNTDFAKICISPKPSGAPMGKVSMPILKELEHQARQYLHSQFRYYFCQNFFLL